MTFFTTRCFVAPKNRKRESESRCIFCVIFDRMFNMTSDNYSRNLQPKKNPISQDFRVTGSVLGLGINGKVVECFSHKTGEKFALKVIEC